MALRDLWGKLTGKAGEGKASDVPPPSSPEVPPAPPEPIQIPPPPETPTPVPEPIREPPPLEIPPDIPNAPVREPPAAPTGSPLGFFARLKQGLSRSTAKLTDAIGTVFLKRKLDDAALEELEEMLIGADLGVSAAGRVVESFRRTKFGREVTDEEVKTALADEIAAILAPVARPLVIEPAHAPHVVLVVGVNGTGKTTTIAKLAEQYRAEDLKVWMVAGDTFRAAAVEQLQIWGERTGAHVVAPAKMGADAAGLAFDGLRDARAAGVDVLLVDTAGRLHNKTALMEELRKVVRVLKRGDDAVPHSTLLVLDATTGQNAVSQVRVFKEMVDITGLVVTKLDGSAKGGVVVALAQEFGLPVHAVGVGEKAADLRPFEARDFARSLVGLED
ncbi:MAG: signal recognition particle-docking protein FtsY [Rubritepida sp.]|nr:signal recognition particle-docking protein FtsY [Rubritepida sp.]